MNEVKSWSEIIKQESLTYKDRFAPSKVTVSCPGDVIEVEDAVYSDGFDLMDDIQVRYINCQNEEKTHKLSAFLENGKKV